MRFLQCAFYAIQLWPSKSYNMRSKWYFYRVLDMANKRGRLERYGFNMTKYGQHQCSFEDIWKLGGFSNANSLLPSLKTLPCIETTVQNSGQWKNVKTVTAKSYPTTILQIWLLVNGEITLFLSTFRLNLHDIVLSLIIVTIQNISACAQL